MQNPRPHPRPHTGQVTDSANSAIAIRVRDLTISFGNKTILNGLNLDVYKGEVLGFIGPSGSGKSVLTRTILGLIAKKSGQIHVFGQDLDHLQGRARSKLERRFGVLFQQGALFSSLTVKQNIQFPMRENLKLSQKLMDELAMLKIAQVGLALDAANKLPSELSGGMIKRAALARALALDPEILFLDEPTSGLDPIGAGEFDMLIATLQKSLGFTVFMVTHDVFSLATICNRVAALGSGKIIMVGSVRELAQSNNPWLQSYFHGTRGGVGLGEPDKIGEDNLHGT